MCYMYNNIYYIYSVIIDIRQVSSYVRGRTVLIVRTCLPDFQCAYDILIWYISVNKGLTKGLVGVVY